MTKLSSRQNEGVLMVTQNNDERILWIIGMNAYLSDMLGYDESQQEMDFLDILGTKTRKAVLEDVEYDYDAKDLLEVLCKHRQIKLQHKDGTEFTMDCTIMRSVARDRHHMFRIVLARPDKAQERKSITHALRDLFRKYEVIEAHTGLPDAASMIKHIETTEIFLKGKGIETCFVYVRVAAANADASHSADEIAGLVRHVGQVIRRNLREDDVIGRLHEDALGIILVDINKDTVHLALNRIKMMIQHDAYITDKGIRLQPVIRQSGVLIQDEPPQRILDICVNLLEEDKTRDMAVFRGASHELGMFRQQ